MIPAYFDPAQSTHAPTLELHNGAFVPSADTSARVEALLAAAGPVAAPTDHGLAPILAVHDVAYIEFLQGAHADWRAAGRQGDVFPYVFPVRHRRDLPLERIDARIGRYAFDMATPIADGTWDAAYANAQVALSALQPLLAGAARTSLALCRPPGHHAGRDYFGGYCYLNNAAIAAQAAVDGGRRVAILDIDYHHGNGTQDIFYEAANPLFVSIHADPVRDYPFYWGHADETGSGAGAGATLNLPLPHGTTLFPYRAALAKALHRIGEFEAELLVVSFGADTYVGDPISHFSLETGDYAVIASDIAALGAPVLIVMEGGYAVDALGANLASFLSGFDH
jgi:acetoin utilization deacetylase AcuC-like enzyme